MNFRYTCTVSIHIHGKTEKEEKEKKYTLMSGAPVTLIRPNVDFERTLKRSGVNLDIMPRRGSSGD